jgi:hypothetical protein
MNTKTESGLVWIQNGTQRLGVILSKQAALKKWEVSPWRASYTHGDRAYVGQAKTAERAMAELESLLRRCGALPSYRSMTFARVA